MALYDLAIEVEELNDGGDYHYMATSPDLPNLIVVGDSPEEVLEEAPRVASALIAAMKAGGQPIPGSVREIQSLPFASRLAVQG